VLFLTINLLFLLKTEMSALDPELDLKHDPEYWKEKFKGKSWEEKEAFRKQHEYTPCGSSYRCTLTCNPIEFAIFVALADDEAYKAEARDRDSLDRLTLNRRKKWHYKGDCIDLKRLIDLGKIEIASDLIPLLEEQTRRFGPLPESLKYPEDVHLLEDFRRYHGENERDRLKILYARRLKAWETKADFVNRVLKRKEYRSDPKGMCSYFDALEKEVGTFPRPLKYPEDGYLLLIPGVESDPEFDESKLLLPEYWTERFKEMSAAAISEEIYSYNQYPIYSVAVKALESHEPHQAEKRAKKQLKELMSERYRRWDKETGFTECMNRFALKTELNGTPGGLSDFVKVFGKPMFSFAQFEKLDGSQLQDAVATIKAAALKDSLPHQAEEE